MDQKRLRELMRKEKEQRAATKPGTAGRPGAAKGANPGGTSGGAASMRDLMKAERELRAASRVAAVVPPVAAGADAVTSALDGRDSHAQAILSPAPDVTTTPAASGDVIPPGPATLTRGEGQGAIDSALMPPPVMRPPQRKGPPGHAPPPSAAAGQGLPREPVAPARQTSVSSTRAALEAPSEEPQPANATPAPQEDDSIVSAAVPPSSELEEVEEDPLSSGVPEGFFDDPDVDAKVRGVEAPSVLAQRALEEGLKRFEKEMSVEVERAEETRHELDETRYEQVAAEEDAFQRSLESRLLDLRKRRLSTHPEQQSNTKRTNAVAAEQGEEADGEQNARNQECDNRTAGEDATGGIPDTAAADGASSSDGDVEFDWRAKDFG